MVRKVVNWYNNLENQVGLFLINLPALHNLHFPSLKYLLDKFLDIVIEDISKNIYSNSVYKCKKFRTLYE